MSALPRTSPECLRDVTAYAEAAQVREAVAFGFEGMPKGTSKERRTRNRVHASLPKGGTSVCVGAAWRNGNPRAFEIAQLTELSKLKSSLYGFGIDIVEHTSDVPVASRGAQFYLKVQQQLQLSKALYDETEAVWMSRTSDGQTEYTELPKLHTYELAGYLAGRSNAFGEALEQLKFDDLPPALQARAFNSVNRKSVADAILKGDTHIIVVTPEIVLKYAVTFKTANEAAAIVNGNAYAGINECRDVILTKEDYAAIGKDKNA